MAVNSRQPYYAVARGKRVGIYRSWGSCKPMVHGWSNASYRKFDNASDAQDFIDETTGYSGNSNYESDNESSTSGVPERNAIYVDGAARGNGKRGYVRAGYGVFFGSGDSRNVAVPLTDVDDIRYTPPTNQRAELHALDHALEIVYYEAREGGPKYSIYTDSAYGKNCLETWCRKWSLNGWINSAGKTVANSDILKRAMNRYNAINNLYYDDGEPGLSIIHVSGHSGNWGNEQADRLANQGADKM